MKRIENISVYLFVLTCMLIMILPVEVKAQDMETCITCSDRLGVTEKLMTLGIDVKGMGLPLTEYLKSGYHVLTY
ncbi:MAG: DsrE family protein [Bacteroidales bacterium]|nr:DsrE family protein [Bacteroidales bacterium]